MSNGTSSALNSEQDLASIPMAGGGLSRLAIARLQSAGVPVMPLLKHVGLRRRALRSKGTNHNSYRSIQLKPGGEKLTSVGFAEHLAFFHEILDELDLWR